MMKHIWSVLCNHSITDKVSNNATIVDILEQLHIKTTDKSIKINAPFECEIISLWSRDDIKKVDEFEVEIDLVDPKNQNLGTVKNKISFLENIRRMRVSNKIKGLTLTVDGIYYFTVRSDKEIFAKIPLEISIERA